MKVNKALTLFIGFALAYSFVLKPLTDAAQCKQSDAPISFPGLYNANCNTGVN